MDFSRMTLFTAMKQRMGWLNQRQAVLTENIANADTPGYRARDLKAMSFKDLLGHSASGGVEMARTDGAHIAGGGGGQGAFRADNRRSYESAPAGNAVILEEQALKVSETNTAHQLTSELYKKHLSLFKTALGKR